ncbi:YukJ family protein [Aspergillus saccharolyticus JOP 1030-1]|uniref:Uncharacterized protein n=1 Tax=Aspergillus saccharolyticus JOP 1030-1 TaxID=1450539 RepID=A0A319ADD2_9EURO|nr:hypothetical protein BP01DRAFT_396250 [Aspergillus saccharolyticus JOP 1030-1]PYH49588.1 hypothetical protein BP01DRAFT_396250 [Aspergillus saccharolyticus JOP 1030-1]
MPIPNYGVWVGRPTRFIAQTSHQDHITPHINLFLRDDPEDHEREDEVQVAINVKSTQHDTRLVFWFIRDFSHHPLVHQLAPLEAGFHRIKPHPDNEDEDDEREAPYRHIAHHPTLVGLDYLRTHPKLVEIEAGRLLPHDVPGNDNDMLDELEPILKDAIHRRARAYVFGSSFGTGIHEVHMNQGSRKAYEDAVFKDGGLVFRFEDGHWEAVFLAFASQAVPTDYRGRATVGGEGRDLGEILG